MWHHGELFHQRGGKILDDVKSPRPGHITTFVESSTPRDRARFGPPISHYYERSSTGSWRNVHVNVSTFPSQRRLATAISEVKPASRLHGSITKGLDPDNRATTSFLGFQDREKIQLGKVCRGIGDTKRRRRRRSCNTYDGSRNGDFIM